jgi:polar amino acid transport system substrate-binding protein
MGTANKSLMIVLLAVLFAGCAAPQSVPTPGERQALVPTGILRVGLYLGGPTNAVKDPVSGETRGVGFDLGQALARRMGVPYEPVIYPTPRGVVDAIKSGGWDVAFIAQDPDREMIMDFTAVYMSIEHGFLVPSGSPIAAMAAVDRPGIRVGVPAGGSVIPPLKRTLKNAEIVGSSIAGGVELLRSGQVDVFAANKANLFEMSDKLPGSRVLDGRFSVDRYALGIPKGRESGLPYVRKFIEEAKAEGLVDAAVKRAGVRGTIKE